MASEIYEGRETIRGRASRGRLRTMYRDEAESCAAETVGVAHTPHGTVEVAATIWRDGVQTILLYTVRSGVLHSRWERRRRPLSERGLTTLARRWAQSLVEPDVVASDRPARHDRSEGDDE
jgi:hypothetical protein